LVALLLLKTDFLYKIFCYHKTGYSQISDFLIFCIDIIIRLSFLTFSHQLQKHTTYVSAYITRQNCLYVIILKLTATKDTLS